MGRPARRGNLVPRQMPNHLHGIVLLGGVDGGATGTRMAPGSLGAAVRSFKAASTRQAKVNNLSLETARSGSVATTSA
jgi:hypothetical protein